MFAHTMRDLSAADLGAASDKKADALVASLSAELTLANQNLEQVRARAAAILADLLATLGVAA